MRHTTLQNSNKDLHHDIAKQQKELDALHKSMETYKKLMNEKKVAATNKINVQKDVMERSENEKAALMVGNEEKTVKRLDKTNEHGQILMTINSLYNTLLREKEVSQDKAILMMISAKPDAPRDFNNIALNERASLEYLKAIGEFIDVFQMFIGKMNSRITDSSGKETKKTYHESILEYL
jgi:hypothetical protein